MILVKQINLSVNSHHEIIFTSISELNQEMNSLLPSLNPDQQHVLLFEFSWEDGMMTFFHAYIDSKRIFDFDSLIQEMNQAKSEIVHDLCRYNKYEGFIKFHHHNPLIK